MKRILALLPLLVVTAALAAPIDTFKFEDPEREAIFHRLSNELRCLVCQNQSIADSNADLAQDLRTEIYGMLEQGKSEEEIVDFMVQRYGDFVLYRPPVKPVTWLLWFGPIVALVLGFVWALRIVRNKSQAPAQSVDLGDEEAERLHQLQDEIVKHRKESKE